MKNKESIINLIKTYEVLTKPQISKITKLSLPTINKYVNDLINEKILEVDNSTRRRTEGKPPTYYRLNRNYGKLLGIFFNRSSIVFLVANIVGNIEKKTQKRISSTKNFTKEKIGEIISKYIRENNLKNHIKFISIGMPGIIERSTKIIKTTITSNLNDEKLGSYLEAKFNVPVVIENDINLVVKNLHNKREYQEYNNLIYVHIGDENRSIVGGSVILNNKLYIGKSSFTGEFSYLAFDDSLLDSNTDITIEFMEKYFLDKIKDQDEKLKFLSSLILKLIPTLNPEILFIECKLISHEDINNIYSILEKFIDKVHIPNIIKMESKDSGLLGTIDHALEFLYP